MPGLLGECQLFLLCLGFQHLIWLLLRGLFRSLWMTWSSGDLTLRGSVRFAWRTANSPSSVLALGMPSMLRTTVRAPSRIAVSAGNPGT